MSLEEEKKTDIISELRTIQPEQDLFFEQFQKNKEIISQITNINCNIDRLTLPIKIFIPGYFTKGPKLYLNILTKNLKKQFPWLEVEEINDFPKKTGFHLNLGIREHSKAIHVFDSTKELIGIRLESLRMCDIRSFSPEQISQIDQMIGLNENDVNLVTGCNHLHETNLDSLKEFYSLLNEGNINNVIVIPMNVKQGDEYIKMYSEAGFNPIKLSEGNLKSRVKSEKVNCLIVDAFRLSEQIYSSSGSHFVVIGGGFSYEGSHSPMEPMKHGCYTIAGDKKIADHVDTINFGKHLSRLSTLSSVENISKEIKKLTEQKVIKNQTVPLYLLEQNSGIYYTIMKGLLNKIEERIAYQQSKFQARGEVSQVLNW